MLNLPLVEESLWQESYPSSIYPQLSKDLNVDVVIVGAGITGLTSAYLLQKAGFKVAALDKSTLGGGTTRSYNRQSHFTA
ncbi:MAG TPA: FAD-dependent oxidoreductase [Candidatus Saccharimonadales bacterium]|jgi:ribulose 1,5-bisphosphate synthetase/thiazole synthase